MPETMIKKVAEAAALRMAFPEDLSGIYSHEEMHRADIEITPIPFEKENQSVNLEHWCEKHQTKFFKRGKMKNYGHPIAGTDPTQWCQEPDTKVAGGKMTEEEAEMMRNWAGEAVEEEDDQAQMPPTSVERENKPMEKESNTTALTDPTRSQPDDIGKFLKGIEIDLETINWKPGAVVAWLRSKQNYQSIDLTGSLTAVIKRMDKPMLDFLLSEIQKRIDAAGG